MKNMISIINIFALCSLLSLNSCKANSNGLEVPIDSKPAVFTINPQTEFQEIHGFGASDAWSCQFVGANWPDQKKNHIADLLFSNATNQEGKPSIVLK